MAVVEANEHAEHASRRIQISKMANSQAASQSTDKSARDQKKKTTGPASHVNILKEGSFSLVLSHVGNYFLFRLLHRVLDLCTKTRMPKT